MTNSITHSPMVNLHSLARSLGYRLRSKRYPCWDESRRGTDRDPWMMILPGRHGHIYVHGRQQLAVATSTRRAMKIQEAVPGVIWLQVGDDGVNASFPLPRLGDVAKIIGVFRQRRGVRPKLGSQP